MSHGINIHQGDQYKVYLEYYANDEPLKNEYTDLELTINCILENGTSKNFQYYFSKGDISWDESEGMFYFKLTQETSFLFGKQIAFQLRAYLPNGDIYASDEEHACIGKTLSKAILVEGEV